ncbi:MAG: hypothetical protein U1F43_22855 [Myxococcota bacterium]
MFGIRKLAVVFGMAGLVGTAGAAHADDYDDEGGSGWVDSMHQNSDRQLDAVDRWDTGYIRENWFYDDQAGNTVELPWQGDSYYQADPGGALAPGYDPGGTNYVAEPTIVEPAAEPVSE